MPAPPSPVTARRRRSNRRRPPAWSALCADVGVDVGPVDTGPTLTAYVADPTRSALDHIARLAAWSGALASIDGDGRVTTRVVDGAQPDVALRHDREVLRISQRTVAGATTYVVAGEAGAGSAAPPDAARPTSDFFAGDRPDGPGVGTRWSFEPALRTPDAAAVAGAPRGRTAGSLRHRTTLDAWLVPALRPGTVVRLDELPDGLAAGPRWVDRVVHRVGPGGATTSARLAEAGAAFDPTRPARLARRRGREPAVSGTNGHLVQTVARLARDEVLARWTTAPRIVRSVHGGAGHACTVQLRESGLVLPRVPIAVGRRSVWWPSRTRAISSSSPSTAATLHGGVVVGRFYDEVTAPPEPRRPARSC